jgi:hypothetical protein
VASNWALGLPRWAPHHGEDGRVHSMVHLHPHRFTLHMAERPGWGACDIEIRVGYASHAFTKSCPPDIAPHPHYSKQGDRRVFCPERYALSLQLPALVANLETHRCYATNYENYFVVEALASLPSDSEYWVFFDIKRATEPHAVKVFVESAYAGDRARAPHGRKRQALMFKALVGKILGLKPRKSP